MIDRKSQASNRPMISKAEYMCHKAAREKLRRKYRMQMGTVVGIFFAVLILCIVMLSIGCSADYPIVGTWDYDTVTVYRFDKNRKGALVLPNDKYAFIYKKDGEKLSIDFENKSATDSAYTYTVNNDTLTLIR